MSLKQKMYAQLLGAIVPLVLVLAYQTLVVSDLPVKLNRLFQANDTAMDASASYKTFLNGVSDAVDTGKLGEKALDALANAEKDATTLHTTVPELDLAAANEKLTKLVKALKGNNSLATLMPLRADINAADAALVKAVEDVKKDLSAVVEADTASLTRKRYVVISVALATLILLVFMIRRLVSNLTGRIGHASDVAEEITKGNLDNQVNAAGSDEVSSLLRAISQMQSNLRERIEHDHAIATEMARIKSALDNVSTGAMIADNDRRIVYFNKALYRILKSAENAIRRDLPSFSADKLMGESIDAFHKNPSHQARLLAEFTQTHVAPLTLGGHSMVVTANPVLDESGKRLGIVAEWADRTIEVQTEREVEELIAEAGRGNFETKLSHEGKEGFFLKVAEGLNQLSFTVSTGLNDVGTVLRAVSQGDLTRTVDANYEGQFGQLKDDANTTVERLREVVGHIKDSTELINTAAGEIAAGNSNLSARTEEQASSLEETASSMEQLNATVKQNAENAQQAHGLTKKANEVATRGGEMVRAVVTTMSGIQESSKKIADIIGVIDSIAFQTNILALNAAVEAARAGEQGRGFAVVATEVRNLAQRSATAAKEIKELIAESVGKVESGTKLVDQAGSTMDDVVTSFQQVTSLVTEISNASREQSSGIDQVTDAVGQMDEVTQQNAALVEEAAAAAESLEEQARSLAQAVAMFTLAESTQAAPRRSVPGAALRNVTPKALPASKPKAGAGGTAPKVARQLAAMAMDEGDSWEEF